MDLDRTLSALSDPTRRSVVDELRYAPRRAGELAAALGTTPAGLSRHLRVLRQSGLIVEESQPGDARVRLYRLRPEPFDELRGWVQDVQQFWSGQLEAFKAHVETRSKQRARALPRKDSKP